MTICWCVYVEIVSKCTHMIMHVYAGMLVYVQSMCAMYVYMYTCILISVNLYVCISMHMYEYVYVIHVKYLCL